MQRSSFEFGVQFRMQHRDIAIANNPLGLLFEFGPIKLFNDSAYPITAPTTQNGFHGSIIQHLLQIGESLRICSGEIMMLMTEGLANFYLKAPLLQGANANSRIFGGHITGRTNNPNGIAFFQRRWNTNHATILKLQAGTNAYFCTLLKQL